MVKNRKGVFTILSKSHKLPERKRTGMKRPIDEAQSSQAVVAESS
jgi:hypothetical protein